MSEFNLITTQINQLASRFDLPQSEELYNVLKATAFKGDVSDAQLSALLIVASQYGLNPWTKEIYAFPDKKNGIIPVVSVDGWSRIINTHPAFDGMDFNFCDDMLMMDGANCAAPSWTECVIHRKDRSHPTIIREYLDEVYKAPFRPKDGGYTVAGPWQTHPKRFSRHKAMIQCARMAFGFGGIYEQDEAERIADTVDMATGEITQTIKPRRASAVAQAPQNMLPEPEAPVVIEAEIVMPKEEPVVVQKKPVAPPTKPKQAPAPTSVAGGSELSSAGECAYIIKACAARGLNLPYLLSELAIGLDPHTLTGMTKTQFNTIKGNF